MFKVHRGKGNDMVARKWNWWLCSLTLLRLFGIYKIFLCFLLYSFCFPTLL